MNEPRLRIARLGADGNPIGGGQLVSKVVLPPDDTVELECPDQEAVVIEATTLEAGCGCGATWYGTDAEVWPQVQAHRCPWTADRAELNRQGADTELQVLLGVPPGTGGVRLPEE